jgi:pSer/pThr/pTyr-binding forkhead associated (FHA) protein
MSFLIVKFEGSVLQKVRANGGVITIGRGPDNSIAIDNLAVSNCHAQITSEQGRLVIEDLDSLNGTFVNNQRVKRAALKNGDVVMVGKHSIYVDENDRGEAPPREAKQTAPIAKEAPRVDETFVLDTEELRRMMQQIAATGERSQIAPARVRLATLVRVRGPIEKAEYQLTGKLTVIGKSEMATVRLHGWFKPRVAAQISRRDDGYYLGRGDKAPTVNGRSIWAPTLLVDGDLIEVCGVQLKFTIKE